MAATTRRRRAQAGGADTLEQVDLLVTQLIKENRALKRQVARLEAGGATVNRGRRAASPAEKALASVKRRLERAVGAGSTGRRGRTAAASKPRATRRPVSPEVAERRRQALEKARRVRAERRAAAAAG